MDFRSVEDKVNCGAGWPIVNDISFFLQRNENKIEVADEIILRIKFYILNIYLKTFWIDKNKSTFVVYYSTNTL